MDGESINAQPTGEHLIMRPSTRADLDSITCVVEAGFPDDLGCPYKFPYRAKYPEYIDQPEKYISLVVTAPVSLGKEVVQKPISIGIWDVAGETKSAGGGLGINERRDANPEHMRAYSRTMTYAFDTYFAKYGNRQLHLGWLITHPDFRRRGAATMLCDWGRKEAMKRGWMWTVIASPIGKLLYEHLGCDLVGAETIRVLGEDESVDIYMMEERFKHTAWHESVIAPVSTLMSLGLGALYYIFGRK
ncbi:uncharacterized protein N7518_002749 [Penicillium psychrosexuale]|uniref:uncharacterized protein n=1 Tax=Penicillium psychrosexuale TaxID=1002107 RepID=UPI0025459806|nr:uncharacterized protein N7518_002749 [Penicillium psychrosexuale]KAJ5800681.1 hypothetical protein N7518_002749 [Penicillium psychrosexuale]